MQRYLGERIRPGGRIAVISNDALGNFVVVTPLLQALRDEHPDCSLHYFGGRRISELAEASDLIDGYVPLHGMSPRDFAQGIEAGYDLVVNVEHGATAMFAAAALVKESGWVCGPSLDSEGRKPLPYPPDERGDLWRDEVWIARDLRARYPFLDSGFIGEIFCKLAYCESTPSYAIPSEPFDTGCDVLIATSASLPDKLWPLEKWSAVIRESGARVGLLGAKPKDQGRHWLGSDAEAALVERGLVEDLRGSMSLTQVVGALRSARAVLTLDNGIMHLAAATETPTVALFRHGIHRLWTPPQGQVHPIEPGPGGSVAEVETDVVLTALRRVLS